LGRRFCLHDSGLFKPCRVGSAYYQEHCISRGADSEGTKGWPLSLHPHILGTVIQRWSKRQPHAEGLMGESAVRAAAVPNSVRGSLHQHVPPYLYFMLWRQREQQYGHESSRILDSHVSYPFLMSGVWRKPIIFPYKYLPPGRYIQR
jgi:hypothetical protein